jgi:hypothetical protein
MTRSRPRVRDVVAGMAVSLCASSALAQVKISSLPPSSPLTGSELVPIVQSGANATTTPGGMLAYIEQHISLTRADVTAALGYVPPATPQPVPVDLARFDGAAFLAHSIAAGAHAKYCIIGDSTSTPQFADSLTPPPASGAVASAQQDMSPDLMWGKLVKKIIEDAARNGVTLTPYGNFYNYAIGGTTLLEATEANAETYGVVLPAWYASPATTAWTSFGVANGCTAWFVNFGVNSPGADSSAVWKSFFGLITSATYHPDIVLITPLSANINASAIASIVVDEGGAGYTTAPTVVFAGACTQPPTATAYVAGGVVGSIVANFGGQCPGGAPAISFTGGGGSGAAAHGVLGPYSQYTSQAGYVNNAGFQRSLCRSQYKLNMANLPPIGCLDMGRAFDEIVLGFDPARKYMQWVINPFTDTPVTLTSFPADLPGLGIPWLNGAPGDIGGDYYIQFTFPGWTNNANYFTLSFGDGPGTDEQTNQLYLNVSSASPSGGAWNGTFNPGDGSTVSIGNFEFLQSGANQMTVAAIDDRVQIWYGANGADANVADFLTPRWAGPFTPSIVFGTPAGGYVPAITISAYAVSLPQPTQALISQPLAYGQYRIGPNSGNGINHDSSYTLNYVYDLVLQAASFSAPTGLLGVYDQLPAYASGFSTGTPAIAGTSGTYAFTLTLGATPASSGVLTMPLGRTGWSCSAVDRTTAAGAARESASTTASVTFALAGTVAGDVLQMQCEAY